MIRIATAFVYLHLMSVKVVLMDRLHADSCYSHNEKVSTQSQIDELFIPFLFFFFVVVGRLSYENVYLHFLKVLPVLPCKRKP